MLHEAPTHLPTHPSVCASLPLAPVPATPGRAWPAPHAGWPKGRRRALRLPPPAPLQLPMMLLRRMRMAGVPEGGAARGWRRCKQVGR